MGNILSQYRGKILRKDIAISVVIKFALQQGILNRFLEEIRRIKPYRKGDNDARFLINYAIGLAMNRSYCNIGEIFLLPEVYSEGHHYNADWVRINNAWIDLVGVIVIKPINPQTIAW